MKPAKLLRCALYTRKSSDEGLDQEFNSLDAQREACEAYAKSQAAEGWRAIDTFYDDGGFSGGSMERPALARLLADVAAGKIDIIVVYKIDRLTRSLSDFARMVELFDKHEVSFVSVTQSFNTTSSMGRLTLNVLLSFAQFEREVTGERIRDKIAASKAKGMWMGGMPPLGYDPPVDKSRMLVTNEAEAETVRLIFAKYLELDSVHTLRAWLATEGISSKSWISTRGRAMGGFTFNRGALFHLLRNPVYLGLIRHKGVLHQGGHSAIVEKAVFDEVQQRLDEAAHRHLDRNKDVSRAPLAGRLFDAAGEPMSPTFSHGRRGQVYRYYVSSSLQKGAKPNGDDGVIQRIPANAIEKQLGQLIERVVPDVGEHTFELPRRIEIHRHVVQLALPRSACDGIQGRLREDEKLVPDQHDPDCLRLTSPVRIRNMRGKTHILGNAAPPTKRDPVLINALRKAHAMLELDSRRLPICQSSPETFYDRRVLRLAFLAPDLQAAIVDGKQPVHLNLEKFISHPIPIDWSEQRKMFAEL